MSIKRLFFYPICILLAIQTKDKDENNKRQKRNRLFKIRRNISFGNRSSHTLIHSSTRKEKSEINYFTLEKDETKNLSI